MATTNGSTAIRDKILASLARYRALRIGKFPCAFWRLSSRPGLTAMEAAEKIGISGMVVDAKDENAANFYEKFGFKRLSASPNRLVLPLTALAALI